MKTSRIENSHKIKLLGNCNVFAIVDIDIFTSTNYTDNGRFTVHTVNYCIMRTLKR